MKVYLLEFYFEYQCMCKYTWEIFVDLFPFSVSVRGIGIFLRIYNLYFIIIIIFLTEGSQSFGLDK